MKPRKSTRLFFSILSFMMIIAILLLGSTQHVQSAVVLCNGRGQLNREGQCVCIRGWTGAQCERPV